MKYVALLRGINVGGKNTVSMAELKICFEDLGYQDVSTYINSGNVIFSSSKNESKLAKEIEAKLVSSFKFDSELIKTLVISKNNLKKVVEGAPNGFGQHSETFHSDVVFLIGHSSISILEQFECNPEVDSIWEGKGVVYFQRLSSKRAKSKLSKIVAKPVYKSMTIRTWGTVNKLIDQIDKF